MACTQATLAQAPACSLIWNSSRRQLIQELQLLATSINALDAGFTIDWPSIITEAQAAVGCLTPGQARNKRAQIIHLGVDEPDYEALFCASDGLLAQVLLYLTCELLDVANP